MSDSSPKPFAALACASWGLPAPLSCCAVPGGLQHRLFRLDFPTRAPLAFKVLAPRAVQSSSDLERFERAETLASLAARNGVPALVALPSPQGRFVGQAQGQTFLFYPWVEGQTLPPHAVSPDRAALMGGFLARVHALRVRFASQSAPVPEAFPDGHFRAISRRAQGGNASWAPRLAEAVDELEHLNALACEAQSELREGWVTGHLDFDQKNVLWQGDNPLILDWEQAKAIHPALEAMGAGLSWAGQSAGAPDKSAFLAWLRGYQEQNALHLDDLERATNGVLGKWTIWLEFNLRRLLDPNLSEDEHRVAFDCAMHALGATLQLGRDGEMYRAWCREAFGERIGCRADKRPGIRAPAPDALAG